MGQGGSTEKAANTHRVDRAGFSETEYKALQQTLRVERDVPEERVDLTAFISQFPAHLRSLVQPVFFQLAREHIGVPTASWPVLVAGLSRLVREGVTWQELFEAWAIGDGTSATTAEVNVYLELAASLCFWCAYPALALGVSSSAEGSDDTDATSGSPELDRMVASLRSSALQPSGDSSGGACGLAGIARRLERQVPFLPRAVGPSFATALLGAPAPPDTSAVPSRVLDTGLSLLLRGADARLWESGAWEPLYRDWCDGRSFNAMLKGTLYYEGPALLVVRTAAGEVIGGLSTCWDDGNGQFGGSSECFLFSLAPSLHFMRSEARSGNYMYLNARNKYAIRGLGFGGQLGFFRLWLDADFEECYALQSDSTYQSGPLLPGDSLQLRFEASIIEIWACGGSEARAAQAAQRARAEGVREQARKVDKSKLLDNEFDKEMFLQNTFKSSEGRDKSCTS